MNLSVSNPTVEKPQGLYRSIVGRPVAVTMVALTFAVFGYTSLDSLALALMPDLSYPTITVRTAYPSADPAQVEREVSERVEERVAAVPDLIGRSSVSKSDMSEVTLEFAWGTDMIRATAAVSEALERTSFANPRIERPQVLRYDPAQDPIIRLMLFTSERQPDMAELRAYAEDILKPELSKLSGVAAVNVLGGVERQVRIYPDEDKLKQYSLSVTGIVAAVRNAGVDQSAGLIVSGDREVLLRVANVYSTQEMLEDLEIVTPAGERIRLGELAKIEIAHKEPETITRYASPVGGFESRAGVLLEILKEGDANILDAARAVRERLYGKFLGDVETGGRYPERKDRDLEVENMDRDDRRDFNRDQEFGLLDRLPAHFELTLLTDESRFIDAAIKDVRDSVIFGGMLAVLVIFCFLGTLRATVLIGISIPLSVIATFIPMQLTGINLNLMSLGGLALGIGMLVDNSVVVLESIARCRDEGDSIIDAAARGTKEVGGAIFASTMTTVCVFFPIVFVEGIAGQVFVPMALTVVFSLLASLVVALFIVPAYAALSARAHTGNGVREQWRKTGAILAAAGWPKERRGKPWWWPALLLNSLVMLMAWLIVASAALVVVIAAGVIRVLQLCLGWFGKVTLLPLAKAWNVVWMGVTKVYPRLLDAALSRPAATLSITGIVSIAALMLAMRLPLELLPSLNERDLYVDVACRDGTPLEATDRETRIVLNDALSAGGLAGSVTGIMIEVGGGIDVVSRPVGEHRARFVVSLASGVPDAADNVKQAFGASVGGNPAFVETPEFHAPTLFSTTDPVAVEVRGQDLTRIEEVARRIAGALRDLRAPEGGALLKDVRTSMERGRPQVRLYFDREKLSRLRLTNAGVANELRMKIGGEVVSDFEYRGEKIDVFINLEEPDRASLTELGDIEIAPGQKLSEVLLPGSTLDAVEAPSEIRRTGNERAVVVTANPEAGVPLGVVRERIGDALLRNEVNLPGTHTALTGQQAELERSSSSLVLALLLAVFLVYAVMAIQFESFIDPLLIMGAMPLAGVGVVYVLWVSDISVSVIAMLGIIVLAGVVVNNAIVLVDYAKTLRRRGAPVREAVRESAIVRLRPIAITTLTTVLGLLPMTGWLHGPFGALASATESVPVLGDVLGFIAGGGEGAEMRAPLAITIIAGLTSSTLLTLIVIPVLYLLAHRGVLDNSRPIEVTKNP